MNEEGNKKDNEKTNNLFVSNVQSNPFGSNVSAEKAYKRGERIVAALYVVTKHISNTEPIKRLAREAGHRLLKDIMSLRSGFRIDPGSPAISSVYTCVRETISLVQLLAVGGFSSRENADMITRALEELTQFIESSRNTELSEGVIFSKEDLLIDTGGRTHQNRVKREVALFASSVTTTPQSDRKTEKGQTLLKDSNSGRRGAILDVLKDGRQIGIKDIASFVVGCSEKTVQRELASLVTDGLVKKEGKKRWSRYSLVSR